MIYTPITIKTSHIGGRGIFITQPVKKGQKVLKFEGPIISWDEAVERNRQDHVVPVAADKYLDIYEPESLVNHSCSPSTGFSNNTTLIALRDLNSGEEITFDYSLVTVDDWTMECNCGSTECRHTISNYADLPQAIKQKYYNVTPPWILALQG
jgi:uncharacterized protein